MSVTRRELFLGYEAVRGVDGQLKHGDRVDLDAEALVRHAFVCGTTGAGKTVFAKGMVEEAVFAGIPVIAVDFKGDIASLALTGRLAGLEALRAVFEDGDDVHAEFAAGLAGSRASAFRAAQFARKADVRLFTPDASLARRLAMAALPSFPEPAEDQHDQEEQDKLTATLVQGFAATMFGTVSKRMEAPVKLLEELVRWCNRKGERLEGAEGIARVLQLVQEPPFQSIGGLPISSYVTGKQLQALLSGLNSRLVGAERSRYVGPRLSVEALIGSVAPGRVPLAVVYLGHLTDFNDQALVLGQLCAEVYRWMRKQGGSSRAKLLLYVDELGGGDNKFAFYPSYPYNPPSKAPLNLLVKQGRSAGVGMLLATQNPMSVDIRGLGNINTWAIGRLTQKNDHTRIKDVLDRMPQPERALQEVSHMPTGCFLTMSDALGGPKLVWERWLYSVHRQLSSRQVRTVHALLEGRVEGPDDPETDDVDLVSEPVSPPISEPISKPVVVPPPATKRRDSGQRFTHETPDPADLREAETMTLPVSSSVRWELSFGDERWPISGRGMTLGRSSGADIQLDDPHISRLHLELVPNGSELVVRALQTKNPTRVDGRLLQGETTVEEGAYRLEVGSLELELVGRAAGPVRL